MNKIVTVAFGFCFALALYGAGHTQNGSNPTGGGGGNSTITAGVTPTSGCVDNGTQHPFLYSTASVVQCDGPLVTTSAAIFVNSSLNLVITGGTKGLSLNTTNNLVALQLGGTGNNNFGIGPSGNDSICLGYNGLGVGNTINCVFSVNDGTGTGGGLARHINYNGGAPTVSSCGTGSPAIDANANDSSGTVTIGTVATTCTITFAAPYVTYAHCVVSSQGVVSGLAYSYTKTAITVTASVLGGDLIDYKCDGV